MINYSPPAELTRSDFHGMVTDLYYEITTKDLDPVFNMVISDRDEILDDGTMISEFAIFNSETVAGLLARKGY